MLVILKDLSQHMIAGAEEIHAFLMGILTRDIRIRIRNVNRNAKKTNYISFKRLCPICPANENRRINLIINNWN
jgi:hypothetical protein